MKRGGSPDVAVPGADARETVARGARIDAVVFDLGGVVVDWDAGDFARHALPDPRMQQAALEHIIGREDWLELDRGALDVAEATRRFARRSGLPAGVVNALLAQVPPFLTTREETVELLRELRARGLRIYYLSNMHHASIDFLERRAHFWPLFDGGVVSCRVGSIKPEPAIFAHLLERYGLAAGCCVFVDDMAENVEAAAALGMHGVLFRSAGETRETIAALTGQA